MNHTEKLNTREILGKVAELALCGTVAQHITRTSSSFSDENRLTTCEGLASLASVEELNWAEMLPEASQREAFMALDESLIQPVGGRV